MRGDYFQVLCLNPNTSSAFTKTITATVQSLLHDSNIPNVQVTCANPVNGPESIESIFDEIISAKHCLDYISSLESSWDGIIIACFSDHPLIYSLREIFTCPVVGIMEAPCFQACSLGHKFSIVTTNKEWKPLLSDGLKRLGIVDRCASVRCCDLPVLALEDQKEAAIWIKRESIQAVEKDGAEVIVLGCAGMSGLNLNNVRELQGVNIIDPIKSSLAYLYSLLLLKESTSKRLAYSQPRFKTITGSKSLEKFYAKL